MILSGLNMHQTCVFHHDYESICVNALLWLGNAGLCSHPLPLASTVFLPLFLQWFPEPSLGGKGWQKCPTEGWTFCSLLFFALWQLWDSVRGETIFCKCMTPERSAMQQWMAAHPRVLMQPWLDSMIFKRWGQKVEHVGNRVWIWRNWENRVDRIKM